MKKGDYIICKSIPKDAFDGSLTISKMYKIEGVANDSSYSLDKIYFIFTNDNHPYLILESKFNDNFESLRDRNLDFLL